VKEKKSFETRMRVDERGTFDLFSGIVLLSSSDYTLKNNYALNIYGKLILYVLNQTHSKIVYRLGKET